jgi:hypothetical protein
MFLLVLGLVVGLVASDVRDVMTAKGGRARP